MHLNLNSGNVEEWEFVTESESMISVTQNSSISTKEKKTIKQQPKKRLQLLKELNYSKGERSICVIINNLLFS